MRWTRLAKLNRRAAKMGLPEIEYTVSDRYMVSEPRYNENHPFYNPNDFANTVERPYVDIEFDGAVMVIGGYKPIATLDYAHQKPTVFEWPGETIPASMRDVHGECGHCGKSRRRNRVFILQNVETGEYLNVGSSCVKDFLGHDPKRILNLLKYLRNAAEVAEGEKWHLSGRHFIDLEEILPVTVAVIEAFGWTSRGRAMHTEGVLATADMVSDYLWESNREYLEIKLRNLDMSEEARKRYNAVANAVREQVAGITPTSTYETTSRSSRRTATARSGSSGWRSA